MTLGIRIVTRNPEIVAPAFALCAAITAAKVLMISLPTLPRMPDHGVLLSIV